MNRFPKIVALLFAAPLAAGCAGRTSPFNEMDQAQVTVLRLAQPTPAVAAPLGGLPAIPGVPPEWQTMANQAVQGVQQMIPPGVIPPGLIPGLNPQGTNPQQPAAPLYKNTWAIVAQMPLSDDHLKSELLDIFGSESSFDTSGQQCFNPGMAVQFTRQDQPQPVELMISLSCNKAMGDGFRWPYPENGFTPDTRDKLSKIYEKLFGPVPAGA